MKKRDLTRSQFLNQFKNTLYISIFENVLHRDELTMETWRNQEYQKGDLSHSRSPNQPEKSRAGHFQNCKKIKILLNFRSTALLRSKKNRRILNPDWGCICQKRFTVSRIWILVRHFSLSRLKLECFIFSNCCIQIMKQTWIIWIDIYKTQDAQIWFSTAFSSKRSNKKNLRKNSFVKLNLGKFSSMISNKILRFIQYCQQHFQKRQ